MDLNEVERINPETSVPSQELHQKLTALIPGVINDGVLDIGKLKALLQVKTSEAADTKENFGLMWAGRKKAIEALHAPSMAALNPDPANSIGWETAKNVFIEGDNLEVLKLLQKSYNDQVNLIYIDPPYNTGNDFVYNDDFSDSVQRYLEVTGQVDGEGNRLTSNTDVSGRKHSNWITMMYPRLMLARNLLTQDGAIFVSIDDNEIANLRLLMDEIFGPENFVGQFVWAAGRKNDSKFVSESHEYIIAYCRNVTFLKESVGEWRSRKEGLDDIYSAFQKIKKKHGTEYSAMTSALRDFYKALPNEDPAKRHKHYNTVDARGIYFPDNISWPGGGGPKYELRHPITKRPCKIPSSGWRFTEDRMLEMIGDERIHFGANESTVPCVKRYLTDMEFEVPYSVFYQDGRGATKRLREFLGGALFDNPKDETVIQRIIEFASRPDALVMDFFAGSGTTGHSVMLQNQKDSGSRRYILVNAPEPTAAGSVARKEGYETVSEITRLRLRKVAETVPGAHDAGLRCYRLGPSSFVDTSVAKGVDTLPLIVETLRADATDEQVAAEVLLKSGVRLDAPWNEVKYGKSKAVVSGDVGVVLARKASQDATDAALKDPSTTTTVFLEDSFASADSIKTNAHFAFKQQNKTMKTM